MSFTTVIAAFLSILSLKHLREKRKAKAQAKTDAKAKAQSQAEAQVEARSQLYRQTHREELADLADEVAKTKAVLASHIKTNTDLQIPNASKRTLFVDELLNSREFKTLKSDGVLTFYKYIGNANPYSMCVYRGYEILMKFTYEECLAFIQQTEFNTTIGSISSKDEFWEYIVNNPCVAKHLFRWAKQIASDYYYSSEC